MIVVSNSSPLVSLGRSGRLELLRQLFGKNDDLLKAGIRIDRGLLNPSLASFNLPPV